MPDRPDILGHDTKLRGWPWVDGTHSWVEPTAYAMLGLRAARKYDHPHVHEAVRLLWDRMFTSGGWNYGNTRVLGNTLSPSPATTGIALSALAGEAPSTRVNVSVEYLVRELQHVRSPLTLGWGLIGLTAWDARPKEARQWLAESAAAAIHREPRPLEDALLLLADIVPSFLNGSVAR